MPVPKNLSYDMWLGSTPLVPYTEKRVHPQAGYDRPGWLRCEQFGAGMITGWGAHHIDSAHWGMDTEYTGPVEIWGTRSFHEGLWDVHGPFRNRGDVQQRRAHDRERRVSQRHSLRGDRRWIFVSRGNEAVTSSDPVAKLQDSQALAAARSENHQISDWPDEVHL
jgi:hypothetical protein